MAAKPSLTGPFAKAAHYLRVGFLCLMSASCSTTPSAYCVEAGRPLSNNELVTRAIQELPATGWNYHLPLYDQWPSFEQERFERHTREYVSELTKSGTFFSKFPNCCSLGEPEDASEGGWQQPRFTDDRYKAFKFVKAYYQIEYRKSTGQKIIVQIKDGILINNCGNTAGITG
jgi:hypothetical protein